jgi:hypothetical protein
VFDYFWFDDDTVIINEQALGRYSYMEKIIGDDDQVVKGLSL